MTENASDSNIYKTPLTRPTSLSNDDHAARVTAYQEIDEDKVDSLSFNRRKRLESKPLKLERNLIATTVLMLLAIISFIVAVIRAIQALRLALKMRPIKLPFLLTDNTLRKLPPAPRLSPTTVIYTNQLLFWDILIQVFLCIICLIRATFYAISTYTPRLLLRPNSKLVIFLPYVTMDLISLFLKFWLREAGIGAIFALFSVLIGMGMTMPDGQDTVLGYLFLPFVEVKRKPPSYHVKPPLGHRFEAVLHKKP